MMQAALIHDQCEPTTTQSSSRTYALELDYVELGSHGRYSVWRFLEFKLGVMPVFQTPQKSPVASESSAYRSSPPLKIRV